MASPPRVVLLWCASVALLYAVLPTHAISYPYSMGAGASSPANTITFPVYTQKRHAPSLNIGIVSHSDCYYPSVSQLETLSQPFLTLTLSFLCQAAAPNFYMAPGTSATANGRALNMHYLTLTVYDDGTEVFAQDLDSVICPFVDFCVNRYMWCGVVFWSPSAYPHPSILCWWTPTLILFNPIAQATWTGDDSSSEADNYAFSLFATFHSANVEFAFTYNTTSVTVAPTGSGTTWDIPANNLKWSITMSSSPFTASTQYAILSASFSSRVTLSRFFLLHWKV